MIQIPLNLRTQFDVWLRNKQVPEKERATFLKWLSYYLDFCQKYHYAPDQPGNLGLFLGKLREKKQTPVQQQQASRAVSFYYELLKANLSGHRAPSPQKANPRQKELVIVDKPDSPGNKFPVPFQSVDVHLLKMEHNTGPSWKDVHTRLAEEIQIRHYSPKTLRTYKRWTLQFQIFTGSRSPELLAPADVKEFLTHLAVKKGVSSSTQNQAFNALLFFYRHVLHKEFGRIEGVVRAKRNRTFLWCCPAEKSSWSWRILRRRMTWWSSSCMAADSGCSSA